jgi:hypothetical protein
VEEIFQSVLRLDPLNKNTSFFQRNRAKWCIRNTCFVFGGEREKKRKGVLLLSFRHQEGEEDEWSVSCPSGVLPPGMDSWYPLERRLGGPQSWSGHRG